jgi:hypothetical protein
MLLRALLLAALCLPFGAAVALTPDCVACRDELTKTLDRCKTEPAGAAQEVCREQAFRDARKCEQTQGTSCELDLLLDPPKPDAAPGKPVG